MPTSTTFNNQNAQLLELKEKISASHVETVKILSQRFATT